MGRLPRSEKQLQRYPESDEEGIYSWSNLRGSGANSNRRDREKLWYPIYVDGGDINVPTFSAWDDDAKEWVLDTEPAGVPVFPVSDDGKQKVWSMGWNRAQLVAETDLEAREDGDGWQLYRKYRPNQDGTLPGTWWGGAKYSASESGTKVLNDILGAGRFSYPKSINTVVDCLRACNADPQATVLDYFAGSGTTGHAVMRLNADDGGSRRFVMIEMGEYFDRALVERTRRVMYSENWSNGKPKGAASGVLGLVKIQVLEQYEDLLDALVRVETEPDPNVPLQYLYRPEEQSVRASLDLTRPFSNEMRVGKDGELMTVDVLETYAYFQGLPVRQVGVYVGGEGRKIRWFQSGRHLVVFRDIDPGDDDSADLLALLDSRDGAEVLHVNEYVDERQFAERSVSVRVVTADDFDRGASWS